jgi:hypothetical protein
VRYKGISVQATWRNSIAWAGVSFMHTTHFWAVVGEDILKAASQRHSFVAPYTYICDVEGTVTWPGDELLVTEDKIFVASLYVHMAQSCLCKQTLHTCSYLVHFRYPKG